MTYATEDTMTLPAGAPDAVRPAAETPLPCAQPESQGFSPARLHRLEDRFQLGVEREEIPGAVVLIARGGKLVYSQAVGFADPVTRSPMTPDTVFAMASMTKPVTSVAAMILAEEGRIALNEPVSRYLPQLGSPRVLTERLDASGALVTTLEPAHRQATVQDLLRHTAGLVYGQFGNGPVHKAYMDTNVWNTDMNVRMSDTIARIAALPLASQPGTTFEYSVATDVLGYLVEIVSGQPLDEFIQQRIARPLGLRDFQFHVNPGEPFAFDPACATAEDRAAMEGRMRQRPHSFSGGAGMYATAGDYLRFAQMLLNGGQLDGVRVLSTKTVRWMTGNHLSAEVEVPGNIRALLRLIAPTPEMGQGFGLGFAVRTAEGRNPAPGSVGDFYWGGASGVYFWVDPEQQLVVVSLTAQAHFETKVLYRQLVRQLVYQALEETYAPQERASSEADAACKQPPAPVLPWNSTSGVTP